MFDFQVVSVSPSRCLSTIIENKLSLRTQNISVSVAWNNSSVESRVITNSEKVESGDIFIAYQGVNADSHQFIKRVIKRKPRIIILEDAAFIPEDDEETVYLLVRSGREAWAWLCAEAWSNPQKSMKFYGVTGTNGKTSICWYVKELLSLNKIPYLSIGTLGIFSDSFAIAHEHTTPDPPMLFGVLRQAMQRGIRHVIMECSSHSLIQKKTGPIRFEASVFSSFSRDHLDFHQTMEEYFRAKCSLFTRLLKPTGLAVISSDLIDKFPLAELPEQSRLMVFSVQTDSEKKIKPDQIVLTVMESSLHSSTVRLDVNGEIFSGKVPFCGVFHFENFLTACLLFRDMTGEFPSPDLWSKVVPVPGRLEILRESGGSGPWICVDYAHTPDALEKALTALRPLTPGLIWLVFGCGGERDRGKRPLMGHVAEAGADRILLTSDNPRKERAEDIIVDILAGFRSKQPDFVEIDRRKAIQKAILSAGAGDVVLIAGKGHESWQQMGNDQFPFDDREVAREQLRKRTERRE